MAEQRFIIAANDEEADGIVLIRHKGEFVLIDEDLPDELELPEEIVEEPEDIGFEEEQPPEPGEPSQCVETWEEEEAGPIEESVWECDEEPLEAIDNDIVEADEASESIECPAIELIEVANEVAEEVPVDLEKVERKRIQSILANRRYRERQRMLEGRPFGRQKVLTPEERAQKNKEKCRMYREKKKLTDPWVTTLTMNDTTGEVFEVKEVRLEAFKAQQRLMDPEKAAKRREQIMLANRKWREKKRLEQGKSTRRPLTAEEKQQRNKEKCRRYKMKHKMKQDKVSDDDEYGEVEYLEEDVVLKDELCES